MISEVRAPGEAGSARLRVLRPLFVKLREWNERIPGAAEDRPATVLIGSQRLPVEPWERGQIARWLGEGRDSAQCQLVLEGLACMAKTMADMERLESSGASAQGRQAELMLDSAIGTALVWELQEVIDRHVGQGELDEAKAWGVLQRKMRRTIASAMQGIDESDRPRVERLAESLTDLPRETDAPRPKQVLDPPARPALAPQAAAGPEIEDDPVDKFVTRTAPRSRRRAVLGAVFAFSLFLWAATVWLPSAIRGNPPQVELSSLGDSEVLRAVVARPPSLYVDVDASAWNDLTHAERWRHAQQAADVAGALEFDGVLLRDENGRPVARWVRGRGIALLDRNGLPPA